MSKLFILELKEVHDMVAKTKYNKATAEKYYYAWLKKEIVREGF